MKEILLNDYFKIEPITHEQFVVSEKTTYEEMGKIVGGPEYWLKEHPEWLGGVAYFDSYIAKRYPIPNEPGKYQWFVPLSEIVKIEIEGESSSGKTELSKSSDGGSIPPSPAH